jgi:hypothetical protein
VPTPWETFNIAVISSFIGLILTRRGIILAFEPLFQTRFTCSSLSIFRSFSFYLARHVQTNILFLFPGSINYCRNLIAYACSRLISGLLTGLNDFLCLLSYCCKHERDLNIFRCDLSGVNVKESRFIDISPGTDIIIHTFLILFTSKDLRMYKHVCIICQFHYLS